MAKHAGAKQTVAIDDASHVVMVNHADVLVRLIDSAASALHRLSRRAVARLLAAIESSGSLARSIEDARA
jgi:hypothetical protein